MPRVSILVSTYNGEKYLSQAIESLLNQSFTDFELIIVNDGSSDNSERVIRSFDDDRVVYLRNAQNQGIAASQNKGLSVARGEYVALQDHDDISVAHRLHLQVEYLAAHPDIAMVGSSSLRIDAFGVLKSERSAPLNDIDLKWYLMFGQPFVHTSLMVRRRIIEEIGGYSRDPEVRMCEDYDFTSRIGTRYKTANLELPLVYWREYSDSVTFQYVKEQCGGPRAVSLRNIRNVMGQEQVDLDALECLRKLVASPASAKIQMSAPEVLKGMNLYDLLQASFYKSYEFSPNAVRTHRRLCCWKYGKHLVTLTYRRVGRRNFSCRATLFRLGLKLLLQRAWTRGSRFPS